MGDKEFFVGDRLTGADAMLVYSLDGAVKLQPGKYPKLEAYCERIQSRPAWKRAVRSPHCGPLAHLAR